MIHIDQTSWPSIVLMIDFARSQIIVISGMLETNTVIRLLHVGRDFGQMEQNYSSLCLSERSNT